MVVVYQQRRGCKETASEPQKESNLRNSLTKQHSHEVGFVDCTPSYGLFLKALCLSIGRYVRQSIYYRPLAMAVPSSARAIRCRLIVWVVFLN